MMEKRRGMPALMFHGISSNHYPESRLPAGERFYLIDEKLFGQIIRRLKDDGFSSTVLSDREVSPARPICLTFDDACLSHYLSAMPILMDHSMRGIFFIAAGEVGRAGSLTGLQLREMARNGMAIGSHTVSHRRLDTLSQADLRRELGDSKAMLEDLVGEEVCLLSLPGGRGGRRATRLARELGYRRVLGSRPGFLCGGGLRGEGRRHVVRGPEALEACVRYVYGSSAALLRQRLLAAACAAAKDLLGEQMYGRLKAGTVALRSQPA